MPLYLLFTAALLVSASHTTPAATDRPCRAERITWTPNTHVQIGDFQGPLGNPLNSAEANTGIATNSHGSSDAATFVVEAETFFDPCQSWFRGGNGDDSVTLAHERIHFDITEVAARRLMQRYATEIDSHAAFLRKHERIYNEVWREVERTQNQYDREVYADRNKQAGWGERVAQQLIDSEAWADKRIELPMQ